MPTTAAVLPPGCRPLQIALKLLLDRVMDEDGCRGDSNGPFDEQTVKERRAELKRDKVRGREICTQAKCMELGASVHGRGAWAGGWGWGLVAACTACCSFGQWALWTQPPSCASGSSCRSVAASIHPAGGAQAACGAQEGSGLRHLFFLLPARGD